MNIKFIYVTVFASCLFISQGYAVENAQRHPMLTTLLKRVRAGNFSETERIVRQHKDEFSRSDINQILETHRATSRKTGRYSMEEGTAVFLFVYALPIIVPILLAFGSLFHCIPPQPVPPMPKQATLFRKLTPAESASNINPLKYDYFMKAIEHYNAVLINGAVKGIKYLCFGTAVGIIGFSVYQLALEKYSEYRHNKYRPTLNYIGNEFNH